MNMSRSFAYRSLAGITALCLGASLTACGGSSTSASNDSTHGIKDGKLQVATSFYPIQYLAQSIGGENVEVTSVTPTNVEPHDFELSPRDISALSDKSVIFYVSGFQPSLDDALSEVSGPQVADLADVVDLVEHDGTEEEHHHGEDGHEHGEDEADHNHEAEDSGHGHSHSHATTDPHFWLDPQRMEAAGKKMTETLKQLDPDHAADYQSNLESLLTTLGDLDSSFSTGLAQCERTTFISSHAAFGYLADRYHLTEASVSGIDPEAEPSPADIAEVKKVVSDTGTTTIFTEELVSPKTAEALANETGTTTAVLSPLESAPDDGDYASAMKSNLEELRTALGCK